MMECIEDGDYVVLPKKNHEDGSCSPSMKSDDQCSLIDSIVETYHDSLWALNKSIHDNPELAFKEFRTHDVLTNFMDSQPGWKVTRSAYGLETAWIAEYDSGTPGSVVSFNAEMDALPNLGHACGHNLIAIVSVSAGLAASSLMKSQNLSGKVRIFGTPGEEGTGGGKIQLLERGAYENVDISLISHPGILNNSPVVRTTAFSRLEVEFFGKAAHAARAPWLGANALDALVIAYNAVSVLRQQTMPTDIIGMSITNGGNAPNIIHAYASGIVVLRARTQARLEQLQDKITACFDSGALATGCKAEIKLTKGYADHVPNHILAASYRKYWNRLPSAPDPPLPAEETYTYVQASTDQGNLSYHMPSVNASFAIPPGPEKGQPHSADFEKAAGMKGAFERALRVAKCLAGVAVDILATQGLLEEVRQEWKRNMQRVRDGDGRV